MIRGGPFARWVVVGLMTVAAVLPAGPAAAQPCRGIDCGPVQYWADITVAAAESANPAMPGGTHTYTVWVTNTGYVSFGGQPAVPTTAGPPSGHVYVVIQPSSPDDRPIARGYNANTGLGYCTGYGTGIVCDAISIPTNTTYYVTFTWQTPGTSGTYTCDAYADTYPWNEYNPYNNSVTVSYEVGIRHIL